MESGLPSEPSVAKACGRCRARKVKCDLQLPRCAACIKQNETCNIADCVAYSYNVVARLEAEIQSLRQNLNTAVLNGNAVQQTQAPPPPTCDLQAEEIGILAVGGRGQQGDGTYVGSAAGSSFARMFLRQLFSEPDWLPGSSPDYVDPCPTQKLAALPPYATALYLLRQYIATTHTLWPFLDLISLRRDVKAVSQRPRECTDAQKFVVFAVLALGSAECQGDQTYERLLDLNEPSAYFRTALRYFDSLCDHPRLVFRVQSMLLLGLWMLDSKASQEYNALWHLSRYAMSTAIEAGLHRQNARWHFTSEESELRARTWWSTYNLERQVAVMTGRVVSMRDHAVHVEQPSKKDGDTLDPSEARIATTFYNHAVTPFRLLTRLRQISARILESVYIARGPDGSIFNTSFQQVCTLSDEVRNLLFAWRMDCRAAGLEPSRALSTLNIEYCNMQLLLNRPNPTFMLPSQAMLNICSEAVSEAIHEWSSSESHLGISVICRGFRQFHALLLVGLAGLYTDWHAQTLLPEAGNIGQQPLHRHRADTETCLGLLHRAAAILAIPSISRYPAFFDCVRTKVYSTPLPHNAFVPGARLAQVTTKGSTNTTAVPDYGESMQQMGDPSFQLFPQQQDFEAYRDHLSGFFDYDVLARDEDLLAWYEAIARNP